MNQVFRHLFLLFLAAILVVTPGCARTEKKLKVGDPAPDFEVRDLSGNTFRLSDHRGKPVILRFWSTDCKYCRADTPIFNRYFDNYRDKGLVVLYVSRNPDEKTVRDFVADLEIGFPVAIDKNGEVAARFTVKIDPQTIIISPDGRIAAAILGGVSEVELERLVGRYLK